MLVSICCITYNHQDFITQTLNGFLLQKTDFDFEIVIGEDCSTDNTASIIESYMEKYPDKIRLLDNSKNLGLQHNFFRTLQECKGEFIAYCEGDDYWSDPLKLQKQVNVFNTNPDVVFCYTNAVILNQDKISNVSILEERNCEAKFDLLEYMNSYHGMPMLTCMFKSKYIKQQMPDFVYNVIQLDYMFRFLIGQHGSFYYLPEVTGVYRRHEGGITNNTIPFLKSTIYVNQQLNKYFNYKYNSFFGNYPFNTYERLTYAYFKKYNIFKGMYYFIKSIFKENFKLRNKTELFLIIKTLFKICFMNKK